MARKEGFFACFLHSASVSSAVERLISVKRLSNRLAFTKLDVVLKLDHAPLGDERRLLGE
jgi:hypothetical protein